MALHICVLWKQQKMAELMVNARICWEHTSVFVPMVMNLILYREDVLVSTYHHHYHYKNHHSFQGFFLITSGDTLAILCLG